VTRSRNYAIGGGLIGAFVLVAVGILQAQQPWLIAWFALFGLALGVATGIDLRERRLPNRITYPGVAIAVAIAATGGWSVLGDALAGLLLAGGLTSLAFWFGQGSLGLGDVKLSAFVGAFLGISAVPHYLLFGALAGAVVAVGILIAGRDRRTTFAYGPSLAVGAVLAVITSGAAIK